MKTTLRFLVASFGLMLATSAAASTFTVDTPIDDTDAHDANPGDGICLDTLNACPLRAALEEANAHAGPDTILFASNWVDQTLVVSALAGPLPAITDRVSILGTSILSYNGGATLLRDAPPMVFIDGSQLSNAGDHGLVLTGVGAGDSIVSAIGVVGFPGDGIRTTTGVYNLRIDRNYIGVRGDGTPAGNGGHGVHSFNSGQNRIGKSVNGGGTGYVSLGNVISANVRSGVRLDGSFNNTLHGNLIGIAPSGDADMGNGEYGVHITGGNNTVGDFIDANSGGNYIAANDLGGIQADGDANRIYANTLGRGETGGFIDSEWAGIVVVGNANTIGRAGLGRNRVVHHQTSAIRVGLQGAPSSNDNEVAYNELGSSAAGSPANFSGNGGGINIANGSENVITGNRVINALGNAAVGITGVGVFVRGDANTITDNRLGFVDSVAGPVAEPNQLGLVVIGNGNIIGSVGKGNQVGGNSGYGIGAFGDNNYVHFNFIGVDSAYAPIGNGGAGLVLQAGSAFSVRENVIGANSGGMILNSVSNSPLIFANWIGTTPSGGNIGNALDGIRIEDSNNIDVHSNRIAFNVGNGIATGSNVSAIAWFQNRMYGNGGIGIDLGADGITPNDPGDSDEGPNRLQNFPIIQNAVLDTVAVPPTLTISYRVDSNAGTAGYPMFVDFYWSDVDELAQGRFFLGTDFGYSTPNAIRTVTLGFVDGVPGGWLTATALEQNRNTSELAARFLFGNPFGRIFADGFE